MNKRRVWLGLVVLAAVLIGLASWPRGAREPSYQGRPLSEWLHELYRARSPSEWTNAETAVRAIGTNAVPYLLERLSYKPRQTSRTREFITDALIWLHLWKRPMEDPKQERFFEAILGFEALDPTASNAVPSLIALLDNWSGTGPGAAMSLGGIGSPALPLSH